MSTWTPTHRDLSGAAGNGPMRTAAAAAFVAIALAAAGLAGFAALQGRATVPERGLVVVLAAFALVAGLALLRKKPAEAPVAHAAPPETGIVLTGSVASDVVLDYDAGTAAKVYRPTLPVKLLYAVSFQARFPYTTNDAAFTAASERRAIAGLLSEYWFGENHVSPVVEIRRHEDGRYVFVTELVRGTLPRDTARARAFLTALQGRFEDAGLPPWQVASYNPRAIGNIIERTDGAYRIIDLESNLVSPFLRPRVLWRAVRAGLYPSFDAIDVDRLDSYLAAHRASIESALGAEKTNALLVSAATYRVAQRGWHASERRWASKLLRAAAIAVDVPGMVRAIGRLSRGGERLATETASAGIETWVDEGLITTDEAQTARASLSAPEMAAATASLGAHLAMSVPLRFPLGSIARSGWTVAARVKGEVAGVRNPEARRNARSVHSAPVAVLGAIPGFGAFAYLAARPFREQRVLRAVMFDQALRHIPFRLHARLHLAALSRWMAVPAARVASGSTGAAVAGAVLTGSLAVGAAVAVLAADAGSGLAERAAWSAFALSGLAAMAAFRSFWKREAVADSASQAGSFLWGIVGVGAALVGLDLATSAHVATVAAFEPLNIPLVPGTSEAHVLVVAAYALTGGASAWAFRHELFARRASSAGIAIATAGMVAALGLEAAGSSAAAAVATASAVALVAASALRIRELQAPAAARESAAGPRVAGVLHRVATTPWLTAKLAAASVAVAGLSLAVSAAAWPETAEPMLFRDFGTVTLYSSALMLVAGSLGLAAWRNGRAESGRGLTRDLWGAWGLAFAVLAFDATPDIHGKLGWLVQEYTAFDHPLGFHRPSDLIVGVYGLAGLAVSAILWRQVFEHPRAILYFFGAVPFAVLTVAIDGFASHAWTVTVLEEGAELLAITFFVAGFAQRYRESSVAAAETASPATPVLVFAREEQLAA